MDTIARNFFSGPIGGGTGRALLYNVGINSAILGGYLFAKGLPMYSGISALEFGVRKLGIPTTLYDIGERTGFTNFAKMERSRKMIGRFRRKTTRGLKYKYRYIK